MIAIEAVAELTAHTATGVTGVTARREVLHKGGEYATTSLLRVVRCAVRRRKRVLRAAVLGCPGSKVPRAQCTRRHGFTAETRARRAMKPTGTVVAVHVQAVLRERVI